jgi:hypothetical protein
MSFRWKWNTLNNMQCSVDTNTIKTFTVSDVKQSQFHPVKASSSIVLLSFSAHESLLTEITCYTLFWFTATNDIMPQTAVYRHWYCIWYLLLHCCLWVWMGKLPINPQSVAWGIINFYLIYFLCTLTVMFIIRENNCWIFEFAISVSWTSSRHIRSMEYCSVILLLFLLN